jgi:2-methylcitrate dehydratase PrpD
MPTGYYRGFVPAGLVGGVGAAAACSVLGGLDEIRTCNALGLAMCTASGVYETVGSMGLPYVTGVATRSGLDAFELARRGLDAPATAFEGEKGMLSSYSDEPADKIADVLATLGHTWRIHGQSYKTMPTETITHGPVEAALALRERSHGRRIDSIRFRVQPIVVKIADERFQRFGAPSSELEARFDLRYCAAAAWTRGRFSLPEMREDAYTDPEILALRERVQLEPDPDRASFDGCSLEVRYTDGTADTIEIEAFRGSAAKPVTDEELAGVFRGAAGERLSGERIEQILDAVWTLDSAPSIGRLMELVTG